MENRGLKVRLSDDAYCFACGPLNPIGLRMEVTYGQGKAMTRLAVKREFQGWKDIVHGGVVAAILDEIMAHAVIHYAGKAVTTKLQITYRIPLHVGEEIHAGATSFSGRAGAPWLREKFGLWTTKRS